MRICSSVGSVTFAVPLLVTAISLLLLLEVFQNDVEPLEPLRPRALVGLDPVVDGLERVAVEPVEPLPSFATHVDRPHFTEHPQVLGHLWLGQPELAHQVVHGALPPGEDVEDLPPPGLGHRVERVGGGRRSCHRRVIIFLYGYMSRSPTTTTARVDDPGDVSYGTCGSAWSRRWRRRVTEGAKRPYFQAIRYAAAPHLRPNRRTRAAPGRASRGPRGARRAAERARRRPYARAGWRLHAAAVRAP